jgi:hypothetical protein
MLLSSRSGDSRSSGAPHGPGAIGRACSSAAAARRRSTAAATEAAAAALVAAAAVASWALGGRRSGAGTSGVAKGACKGGRAEGDGFTLAGVHACHSETCLCLPPMGRHAPWQCSRPLVTMQTPFLRGWCAPCLTCSAGSLAHRKASAASAARAPLRARHSAPAHSSSLAPSPAYLPPRCGGSTGCDGRSEKREPPALAAAAAAAAPSESGAAGVFTPGDLLERRGGGRVYTGAPPWPILMPHDAEALAVRRFALAPHHRPP